MSGDPYVELCLHVQAIRRLAEGRRTPLAPALGVAADIYPHQVGNVLRVLTDVKVRHLLADEVGLGKTVQALMILNALHDQNEKLRVLVVVPDRLVPQWRDEIMIRAHTAPLGHAGDSEADEALGGGQYIRIVWEAQLRRKGADGQLQFRLGDIDPDEYDVLVVDELHRLTSSTQDRIVRVAPDFQHVLVLTATPSFQHSARNAQLFALLEPEKTAKARRGVTSSARGIEEDLSTHDDLSTWPEWATEAVVVGILDREADAAGKSDELGMTTAAMTHCSYRRVIRTRRVDYSGILPHRAHNPISVEPLGAETSRQTLMWDYFQRLNELTRRFDPVLLAKRVVLSPPSLEQRVDFLRREGHDRDEILERVKPLVHRSKGDSRVDALLDLLVDIWTENPEERVLVAAQDNLTVDYLYDIIGLRIPEIGPLSDRKPLKLVRIRQGMATEAVEGLGGAENLTNASLEAFQRGEAQLLIAPEAGQVGLNLQCARILVLYSVPWRPQEVEQWIGRLDRIGNTAMEAGRSTTVDVYTIVQKGLVDHKVVDVLARFGVFERGVNLDGDHVDEIAKLIEDAALAPEQVDWDRLESESQTMADQDRARELDSPLKPHLPWDAEFAVREHRRIQQMAPLEPVLRRREGESSGPLSWDRALEGLVSTLKAAGQYHILRNQDPATATWFQTLWYRFGPKGTNRHKPVISRVLFTFGANPNNERHPRHAHAFITRRSAIGAPPLRHVGLLLDDGEYSRPRRFLNFGNPLHDELVRGWLPLPDIGVAIDVSFRESPEFWQIVEPGLHLLRVAIVDPSDLIGSDIRTQAIHNFVAVAQNTDSADREPLLKPFVRELDTALEADVRWLRWKLEAGLQIDLRRLDGTKWRAVDDGVAHRLLDPLRGPSERRPKAEVLNVDEDLHRLANTGAEKMKEQSRQATSQLFGHRVPEFESELRSRLHVVRDEGEGAVAVAAWEQAAATERAAEAHDSNNPGLITRRRNELAAAEDRLAVTKALWQQREEWLENCATRLNCLKPEEFLTALIRVSRAG